MQGSDGAAERKMDIVYVVGNPSKNDDIELRWSLRSVAKYGRNVGRIIVTSPVEREWLSDEVTELIVVDPTDTDYKHLRITHAILKTVEMLGLDGEFLVSSDDHFIREETDFSRYPFYVRDWKVDAEPRPCGSASTMLWRRSVCDTGIYLRSHGMPCLNFQGHVNAHWHGGLVREFAEHFAEAQLSRYGFEPHLLMANLWLSKDPMLPIVYREDNKIFEFNANDSVPGCFSCCEKVVSDPAFVSFMNAEFGEKCRYER